MLTLILLAVLAVDGQAASPRPTDDLDPVHATLRKIGAAASWPVERAAREELAAQGDRALRTLTFELEEVEDVRVRRACYEVLGESFAQDGRAVRLLAVGGLGDKDDRIRYGAAYRLGELKAHAAHRRLRAVMEDRAAPEYVRLAAAKSLAQLGEPDTLILLYRGVTADGYMARSMGNIGLKALTGKDLDDFEGYHFGEGAFVSGGHEAIAIETDAVAEAEKKARRFAAAAAYFRWLRAERPDLAKHVAPAL